MLVFSTFSTYIDVSCVERINGALDGCGAGNMAYKTISAQQENDFFSSLTWLAFFYTVSLSAFWSFKTTTAATRGLIELR